MVNNGQDRYLEYGDGGESCRPWRKMLGGKKHPIINWMNDLIQKK